MKKIFVMLMIMSILTTGAVALGNNTTAAVTGTTAVTTTIQPVQTTIQPVQTTIQPVQTVPTEKTPGKFRIGPTVKIRPLNDDIDTNKDGLIEIYMDNPSLNDIELNVDARISVPAGIHVYGQGFGEAGAAGTVFGTFTVPPGSARTIYITIKAEKTGDFFAQFSGLYYPGDNKDAFQPISLTAPFKVKAASKNPNEPGTTPTPQGGQAPKTPGLTIVTAILVVTIMAYILKKR